MFFGEFKKQKKLPKKMNMESLVYIVFGRRALKDFNKYIIYETPVE